MSRRWWPTFYCCRSWVLTDCLTDWQKLALVRLNPGFHMLPMKRNVLIHGLPVRRPSCPQDTRSGSKATLVHRSVISMPVFRHTNPADCVRRTWETSQPTVTALNSSTSSDFNEQKKDYNVCPQVEVFNVYGCLRRVRALALRVSAVARCLRQLSLFEVSEADFSVLGDHGQ